jgi:L-ribulose-5-phosphate 4-epimerase
MLDDLKKSVCEANLALVARGLVIETWGNVSGADRPAGCMVIKPSGLPYDQMKPRHMVVVSLENGSVVEGELRPSSDAPTHLALYRAMASVGGIVHTHSLYATAWAQARRDLTVMGTTHADYFHGPVPCTRLMTPEEIKTDYEANTGKVIVERMSGIDPAHMSAALVADHGPFAWGRTPAAAVEAAAMLEHVARLASETIRIEPYPRPIRRELLDRHYLRKHGPDRYYGQDG